MTGRRPLARYFWASCAVIAVNALILWALRIDQVLSAQMLGLAGGLGAFLVMLLPAAIFGLLGGILAVFRVHPSGQRAFFGTASIVNFILTYCGFGVVSQTPAAPRPTAVLYAALACTLVTVIPPAVIYFRLRALDIDEDEPGDPPNKSG